MRILFTLLFLLLSVLPYAQTSLQLFGGEDHKIYLGCLNCDDVESNSIWNDVGTYGSDVSNASPWNDVASYLPVT